MPGVRLIVTLDFDLTFGSTTLVSVAGNPFESASRYAAPRLTASTDAVVHEPFFPRRHQVAFRSDLVAFFLRPMAACESLLDDGEDLPRNGHRSFELPTALRLQPTSRERFPLTRQRRGFEFFRCTLPSND